MGLVHAVSAYRPSNPKSKLRSWSRLYWISTTSLLNTKTIYNGDLKPIVRFCLGRYVLPCEAGRASIAEAMPHAWRTHIELISLSLFMNNDFKRKNLRTSVYAASSIGPILEKWKRAMETRSYTPATRSRNEGRSGGQCIVQCCCRSQCPCFVSRGPYHAPSTIRRIPWAVSDRVRVRRWLLWWVVSANRFARWRVPRSDSYCNEPILEYTFKYLIWMSSILCWYVIDTRQYSRYFNEQQNIRMKTNTYVRLVHCYQLIMLLLKSLSTGVYRLMSETHWTLTLTLSKLYWILARHIFVLNQIVNSQRFHRNRW